jgi:hypothetical protein
MRGISSPTAKPEALMIGGSSKGPVTGMIQSLLKNSCFEMGSCGMRVEQLVSRGKADDHSAKGNLLLQPGKAGFSPFV